MRTLSSVVPSRERTHENAVKGQIFRGGTIRLPPGKKWRDYELRALGLRDFARIDEDSPLDPYQLAHFARLLVLDFNHITGLSAQAREHLIGPAATEWSGGACSRPLPDGRRIIILNPKHGRARTNATLMEEICHVFLGHRPNRLAFTPEGESGSKSRDYQKAEEEAAYAIGAAALVPYGPLRKFIHRGKTSTGTARHFRVSRRLVEYRLKVTKLWELYKSSNQPED
ncbi:MAG TPA: ImmA/IrrE family metallo-endopeptidase [Pyrinomonadaceae bacterium]|nr:ImmA/IrrE family metallo-endopeptidase [Pyrinomonadaceae bacterium]